MDMPNDEDDRYYKTLLSAVQDMSATLGSVREQVNSDLAAYLARYREDAHRSIMAMASRVTSIEQALREDAVLRTKRQEFVDAELAAIKKAIENVARAGAARGWQIWVLLILMVLLVIGVWR